MAQKENGRQQTPLALCVQYGNTAVVELLLANDAKVSMAPNQGGWSLMDAVAYYNVFAEGGDIPGILAKNGLPITSLHQAAGVGNADKVKQILQQGVDVNVCKIPGSARCDKPIHWAARSGYADVIQLLVDAGVRAFCSLARWLR